jgi:WD40 repeat protein
LVAPEGSVLATGLYDGRIELRRSADGALIETLHGHTGELMRIAFGPDGSLLASGAHDGTVRLWGIP